MTTELNQPLLLSRGGALPNRIAKAAMSERIADPEGAPSVGLLRLYERWATGGCGLLITGNVMVDRRALGETGNVVVEDERHLDALRAWARAAKSGGARVWMQIYHPGRQSPRFLSKQPVAPSAVPMAGAGSQMFAAPRALRDEEIRDIITRFARTAEVAETAGFDGVQIHAAHGYLVNQFLSPVTNQRQDDWGGSAEARMRFIREVVEAVRAATSERFSVAVKLNSADFQKGGFSETESMAVVRALAAQRIDLLEISGGTYESGAMFAESKRASTKRREAFFIDYAEKVRAEIAELPLMVTGGFRTRGGMLDAITSGAIDVVGMARPLCVEPELPARLLSGEAEAARVVKLATGVKKLDSLVQASWYQSQLTRMARGLAPDARMTRPAAIARYLWPRRRFDRASLR